MSNIINEWWIIGRVCFIKESNAITPNGVNAVSINGRYKCVVRKKINTIVINKVEAKNTLTLRDAYIRLHNISIHNRGLFINEVEMFFRIISMVVVKEGLVLPYSVVLS